MIKSTCPPEYHHQVVPSANIFPRRPCSRTVRYFTAKHSMSYRKCSSNTLGILCCKDTEQAPWCFPTLSSHFHLSHKALTHNQWLIYSKVQVLHHGNQYINLIDSSAFYKVMINRKKSFKFLTVFFFFFFLSITIYSRIFLSKNGANLQKLPF